jgi:hypothetical protein
VPSNHCHLVLAPTLILLADVVAKIGEAERP